MPTAAKLFAAVFFAFAAFFAAHLYTISLPEGRGAGVLREVSAVVGVLCGWFIMGPVAHRSVRRIDAMGAGIRTSFTIVIFVVLIFACVEVFDRAIKGRYQTPMDAVLGVFENGLAMIQAAIRPDVLAVLLLGGLFGGALAHWAGKRWN